MGNRFSHTDGREHIGEHNDVHGYTGGKQPLPKGGTVTVHGGMTRQVNGAPITGGGHDASYLDSLSGATVPGPIKSAPGWSNGSVRSGNPTAHAPASKVTRAAPVHPSMSKGAAHDQMLTDLGDAILSQARKAGSR